MNTTKTHKICFVFGTRPEIIKLAPVIKECIQRNVDYITIHTGQHYSENMDKVFFDGLDLPPSTYNLKIGSKSHAHQTAAMLTGVEDILTQEHPTTVIVQGDTNSVLAGAIAAVKLHIPVAHIEAGLRSYDRTMPEEINRILVGSVATFHFTPTEEAAKNLRKEGVSEKRIFTVGNTIVDTVLQNFALSKEKSKIIKTLKLEDRKFSLVTIHRPENTDYKIQLESIIAALEEVSRQHDLLLVWPIHPRTAKQLDVFGLSYRITKNPNILIIDPVNFMDMLSLQAHSQVTLTDSGGIQEESCILHVPCVTIRNNTERPESVAVGANILAGNNIENILTAVTTMLQSDRQWKNPFGDGTAANKIIEIITSR